MYSLFVRILSKEREKLYLFYTQSDIHRKPAGQITLNEVCRVTRSEGAHTFEVNTGKKTYYLTADNTALVEDWVRVLQVKQTTH